MSERKDEVVKHVELSKGQVAEVRVNADTGRTYVYLERREPSAEPASSKED